MKGFVNWIREHDDRWSFVLLYVGGAILLSVFTNLFWVTMLMTGNFFLKLYRNTLVGKPQPLLSSLWQVKLDISLVIFAVMLGLYAEHVFAALGLSQAARAGQAVRGIQMATRFGLIERGLKVFLLTIDDQARLVNAIVKARRKKQGQIEVTPEMIPEPEAHEPDRPWKKWGKGDVFTFVFAGVCFTLVLLAPFILGLEPGEVAMHIIMQLSPMGHMQ